MEILVKRLQEAFWESDIEDVQSILSLMQEDGSFRDIDYSDNLPAGWPSERHLKRARALSYAYLQDQTIGSSVIKVMEYWFRYDFKNPNWWYNDIGVPMQMRLVLLNCKEILSDDIKAKIIDRLQTFVEEKWTGTNKLWLAENVIFRGVLTDDEKLIERGKAYVEETILVADVGKEGVQVDCSFAQHGKQLYNHGYGWDFIIQSTRWFEVFRDTKFAFAASSVKIITDLYLKGNAKMGRFGTMDFSARGREIGRYYEKDTDQKNMHSYKKSATILAKCNKDKGIIGKLHKTIAFIDGTRNNPYEECNTAYWILKYMTHHRDGFYASVRMASKDVLGGDVTSDGRCIQGENYLDGFGAYGLCVYMRDGKEYDKIFPVLDWGCMPGTTTPDVELPVSIGAFHESEFVGNVSDGFYGMAAMDMKKMYTYDGEQASFGGKKAYFFFDECVLHLGTQLYSNTAREFHTTLDQCLLRTPVYVDGRELQNASGYKEVDCRYVYHNHKAYVNLDKQPLKLKAGESKGSYKRISVTGNVPECEIKKETFILVKPHNNEIPEYQYAVLPDTSLEGAEAFIRNLPFTVISNSDVQAVCYKGSLYSVFYKTGSVSWENHLIEVDTPCMLILDTNKQKLYVSTSDKCVEKIVVQYQGKQYLVQMPGDSRYTGKSIEIALTQ